MKHLSAALLLAGLAGSACADPVHDNAVAALGPEDPSVPPGPTHRPGQPCVLCHDGTGPASFVMSVGGTVFQEFEVPGSGVPYVPLALAAVDLVDSQNHGFTAETNCAGNFFVQPGDFTPVYPMYTQIRYATLLVSMRTHIGRDGSCASCHSGKESQSSVDPVYLTAGQATFPAGGCP